jgi:4a-hydroxytetrahydrobiopterin dehydratase
MAGMTDTTESRTLTRTQASDAVSGLGWRLVLGVLRANVPAASLSEAAGLAQQAIAAAGPDADAALWADVRHDVVVLSLKDRQAS